MAVSNTTPPSGWHTGRASSRRAAQFVEWGAQGLYPTPQQVQIWAEHLEVLNGDKNRRQPKRAAVRVDELLELVRLAPKLQSAAAAGSTPTAAEYDALRKDVAEIHKRLLAVSKALERLIR